MKTIGEKIKTLRKEFGLNQELLCSYLGIDQSTLSKIESNTRNISIDQLEKLCVLFGCSLSDLQSDSMFVDSMKFSLRSTKISAQDLNDLANINEIALNSQQMAKAIKEKKW